MTKENKIDGLITKYCDNLSGLNEGLDPDVLAYWYKRIEDKAKDMCNKELGEKITFTQDRLLWMKFDIHLSKRAVPLVLETIRDYISLMPFSTSLYFEKVYQIIIDEFNKDLI
ncbi:MAG TPA: hypothetical protein VN703_03660 [Candidatus Sulfopaludibacter sp.]|jgi:hypothetical protein|nr:hypothetical protein [Candidatus Sulfopaludibacter sp.]